MCLLLVEKIIRLRNFAYNNNERGTRESDDSNNKMVKHHLRKDSRQMLLTAVLTHSYAARLTSVFGQPCRSHTKVR